MDKEFKTALPTICIAGQNAIAVHGLAYAVNAFPNHPICYLPVKADTGVDGWQPSLIKQAKVLGVPRVTLESLYAMDDLVFISLQFDEIINTKRFKTTQLYNIHFSKLPKYKGVCPAIHAILNGETETGVTLHCIEDGIDTGDIIGQATVAITRDDTARSLYLKQMQHAQDLFEAYLTALVTQEFEAYPQPAIGASYYSKKAIDFANVTIDWRKTAYEVHNQLRAFHFREYQMPCYQNWQIVSTHIQLVKSTAKPGTLITETESYFELATIDYNIYLIKDYLPVLWRACEVGDLAAVHQACKWIQYLDTRNKHGWNALIIAAYHGHLPIVKALLALGLDVNSTNYKGTTALMYALSHYEAHQNDDVFQYLLNVGADIHMRDTYGKTVMDYLHKKGLYHIGKGAAIGGGAVLLPGIIIGRGAIIGAGAAVTRDVAEFATVVGNPAKQLDRVS
ncbi:MAG: formyltransferase family protein, partial [Nitrosomonas sp.]